MHGRHNPLVKSPCHYLIDGRRFPTAWSVFAAAKEAGFDGTFSTIINRLARLRTSTEPVTFADIAKPTDKQRAKIRKQRYAKDKAEIVNAVAALDARKRELEGKS